MSLNTISNNVTKLLVQIARRDIFEYYIVMYSVIGIVHLFGSSPEFALRQLFFATVGLTLFYFARLDFVRKNLKHLIIPFYLFTIALLAGVLFTQPIKGASRWFNISGFSIQPSEFAKVATILSVAYFVTYIKPNIKNRLVLFTSIFSIILIPAILVFVQPDFGSAFLISFSAFLFTVFVLRISKSEVFVITALGLVSVIVIFTNLKEFQKQRIVSYIASFSSSHDAKDNFNSLQAKIAIGSGGFFGKGLGSGTQSKLAFLPEDHTDFAFSSFAEQFGLFGVCILLSIIFLTTSLMIQSINMSIYPFVRRSLVGVIILFVTQVFVNICMNVGLLPIVGVPLPFISYGGSSLLVWFFMMGLF